MILGKEKLQYIVLGGVLVVMLAGSLLQCEWIYSYKSDISVDIAGQYAANDCIYIYDQAWKISASFLEVENYNSVTFYQQEHIEMFENSDLKNKDKLVFYIISESDEEILQQVIGMCPNIDSYKKISEFAYSKVYFGE